MASRLELHDELCGLLGSDHVYFQPPSSVSLIYPCIIYHLSNIQDRRADNMAYTLMNAYEVMYIDKNPDNTMKTQMIEHFQKCRFNRFYTADNLNHYVFVLYY